MADGLTEFASWLSRNGHKQTTIRNHVYNIRRIQSECSFIEKELESYFYTLYASSHSPQYINVMMDSVSQYTEFLGHKIVLKRYKKRSIVKSTLSDEEIDRILTLPKWYRGQYTYKKWTLFFKIMAYSGMRPGEVANLTVDAIDFGRKIYILPDTKTVVRNVPIAPSVVSDLEMYIKTLKTKYLFWSERSKSVVESDDWNSNFHSRLKKLGIKRMKLRPYSFRYSFITRMLEEDVNLFKVQKIVGHRQIQTTAGYCILTTKDICQTIEKDRLGWKDLTPQRQLQMVRDYILSLNLSSEVHLEISESRILVDISDD